MLFICATDIEAVTLAAMPTEAAAATAIAPATQQRQLSFGNPSARGGREGRQEESGRGEKGRLVSQSLLPCGYLYCLRFLFLLLYSLLPHPNALPTFCLRLVQLVLRPVLFVQWVVQLLSLGKNNNGL